MCCFKNAANIYPSSKYEYFPIILLLTNHETLFNMNIVLSINPSFEPISALFTITGLLFIWRAAIGRKRGVYFKSKMSIDWKLMSALKKNCLHLRTGQLLHICKQYSLDILYLFKGRGAEMRPSAFLTFSMHLQWGRLVSLRAPKGIQDGGHQGK